MTFYEAALRVLEGAGRPLHVLEITEKSIAQNLLSHIGKTPEQTMLSRLAAMARRARDRRVIVTAKDTFALSDWALPEDPQALAETGVPEPHPEESLPPLRPIERHPEPRVENVRAAGRSERKRRREDEDDRGRKRRFPPIPDVVFEILSESADPLSPDEVLEKARSRQLAGEELRTEQILSALLEDNQRRIDGGRRPQFTYDAASRKLALERAGSPSDAPPLELQAAFAAALGIPLEGGRPVLPKRAAAAAPDPEWESAQQTLKTAVKDVRRAVARAFRARLLELDGGTFEKCVVKMLHALGFRELKVAKRSKEGPLLTARKRDGSLELRYAVRILKGPSAVERRTVHELRKDLGHHSAQVGLVISAADLRGDAKSEAVSSGALVLLWCSEGLAEKFLEAQTGVSVKHVETYELDDAFFESARVDAEESRRRREERTREKDRGAPAKPAPTESPKASVDDVEAAARLAASEGSDDGEGDEGEDELAAAEAFAQEGKPEGEAAGAAAGERKRRRRRRRGRRGRGAVAAEGGQAGAPGAAALTPEGVGSAEEPSGASEGSASAGSERGVSDGVASAVAHGPRTGGDEGRAPGDSSAPVTTPPPLPAPTGGSGEPG